MSGRFVCRARHPYVLFVIIFISVIFTLGGISCASNGKVEESTANDNTEEKAVPEEEEKSLDDISPEGEIRPDEEENVIQDIGEVVAEGKKEQLVIPDEINIAELGAPLYPYGRFDDELSSYFLDSDPLIYTIYIYSEDSFKEVTEWYRDELAGFDIYIDDSGKVAVFEKDSVRIYVYEEMETSGWETTILLECVEEL